MRAHPYAEQSRHDVIFICARLCWARFPHSPRGAMSALCGGCATNASGLFPQALSSCLLTSARAAFRFLLHRSSPSPPSRSRKAASAAPHLLPLLRLPRLPPRAALRLLLLLLRRRLSRLSHCQRQRRRRLRTTGRSSWIRSLARASMEAHARFRRSPTTRSSIRRCHSTRTRTKLR